MSKISDFVVYADGAWTVAGQRHANKLDAIRAIRNEYHVGLAQAKDAADAAQADASPEMAAKAALERKREAGPELYAAAQMALAVLCALPDQSHPPTDRAEVINRLQAALAKADGQPVAQ